MQLAGEVGRKLGEGGWRSWEWGLVGRDWWEEVRRRVFVVGVARRMIACCLWGWSLGSNCGLEVEMRGEKRSVVVGVMQGRGEKRFAVVGGMLDHIGTKSAGVEANPSFQKSSSEVELT